MSIFCAIIVLYCHALCFTGAAILSLNRSVYFTALILKRFFDFLNLARFLLRTVTWQPFYGDGPDAVALFWSKYMRLKSDEMAMSSSEKSWLNWFGSAGKLKMGWACWLNKSRYPVVEKAFESIANTRMNILQQWTNSLWDSLETLSSQLRQNSRLDEKTLMTQLGRSLYVSEYFVIDSEGYVLETTFSGRKGARDLNPKAISEGLKELFLHGPYIDQLTLSIGPSSSKFHDEVTLMFYLPIDLPQGGKGCLCARVPNDVIGDLIQREAGHIYTESGDNYIFMVEPRFDPTIAVGAALSRSRFEDNTFSHGENLKSGIHTHWGVVRVQRHTEFVSLRRPSSTLIF
jgi:hypothetical protein